MNTNKIIASAKESVVDHMLPVLGGAVAGQFLGPYRLYVGAALSIGAIYMNKPAFATAGAAMALTPLAATAGGVSGLEGPKDLINDGNNRLKVMTQSLQQALWPFGAPTAAKSKAMALPTGTSGLGDTVYAGYPDLAGDDSPELLGNVEDFPTLASINEPMQMSMSLDSL